MQSVRTSISRPSRANRLVGIGWQSRRATARCTLSLALRSFVRSFALP